MQKISNSICIPQSSDNKKYVKTCQKNFDGLFKRGGYCISDRAEAGGVCTFAYQFLKHVKWKGPPKTFEKLWPEVQGF